jgi:MYXO-CTERM domain-containing protein
LRRTSFASAAILAAVVTAATTVTSPASANGRFPESNQIAFSANDPNLVILRVTFGLLVSHDKGKTFDWVCEQSIGFSGVEDPMYSVTPSKTYIGTTFQGVTISKDEACGWNFVGGDLAQQVFIDLSANPADSKNVVVFASSYDKQDGDGGILFTSKVWETKDEGASFQQLGQALDPAYLGYTIDLTKSDPNRIYITVVRKPGSDPPAQALLLTSKNHGTDWEELPVPLVGTERSVYVAAVDPNNPERVYLRTSNMVDQPTRLILREAVDGGQPTLKVIYTGIGGLLGFALSADGSRVYVGGPRDGVNVANTTDFQFTHKSDLDTGCLAVSEDGLWACSNERGGFVAGLSTDDGATFQARLHFCDIRGPLACPPESNTYTKCNGLWPAQKALLGCGGDVDAGKPDASPFGDGGDFEDDGAVSGSTCNCRAATPVGPWGAAVTIVGLAIALLRRGRRRR